LYLSIFSPTWYWFRNISRVFNFAASTLKYNKTCCVLFLHKSTRIRGTDLIRQYCACNHSSSFIQHYNYICIVENIFCTIILTIFVFELFCLYILYYLIKIYLMNIFICDIRDNYMTKFMLIEYRDILQILFQGLKYTIKKNSYKG